MIRGGGAELETGAPPPAEPLRAARGGGAAGDLPPSPFASPFKTRHFVVILFFWSIFSRSPRGCAEAAERGRRPRFERLQFPRGFAAQPTTTPGVPARAGINKLQLNINKLHLPALLAREVRPASSPFALRRADKRSAHTQRGRWRRFPSGEGGGRGGRGKREGRGVGGVGRRGNPRGGSPEEGRQPGRARVLPAVGRG